MWDGSIDHGEELLFTLGFIVHDLTRNISDLNENFIYALNWPSVTIHIWSFDFLDLKVQVPEFVILVARLIVLFNDEDLVV